MLRSLRDFSGPLISVWVTDIVFRGSGGIPSHQDNFVEEEARGPKDFADVVGKKIQRIYSTVD